MVKKKEINRILLTGGHAGTTALAVVEEIKKRNSNWNLYWIGARNAHEGKDVLTLEAKTFPGYGVTFIPIRAGKLQRKWSRHTIPSLMRIPLGFIDAYRNLKKIKPQIVVSFGGYTALPVVFCAWLQKIPVVLQEQITGLGFANRVSLPFANKVALARKEGLPFAKGKGVVLGNPVNPAITKLPLKQKKNTPTTIFIFAGSRGSQNINNILFELLSSLLSKYRLIHHTGDLDYKKFSKLRNGFSLENKKRYEVYKFIEPSLVPKFYERSDILIGRAGANTVSELMVVGIPSILIPLTWTNYQEQVLNAKSAQRRNIVKVLDSKNLDAYTLMKTIELVDANWEKMVSNQKRDLAELDKGAASKIVDLIEELM